MSVTPSAVPLLMLWETYCQQQKKPELRGFLEWALAQQESYISAGQVGGYSPDSIQAAILIGRLNKYLRLYTKAPMAEMGLSGQDDFGFLASLEEMGQATIRQLCDEMLTEFSTGNDIVKRLMRQELVQEEPHPTDGRSKLLSLTPKGRQLMRNAMVALSHVEDVLGDLNPQERSQVVRMLHQLDHYHNQVVFSGK